jgi:C1A family cysteine protease
VTDISKTWGYVEDFTGYPIELEDRAELAATATDFAPAVKGLYSAPEEIDPREWHVIENQSSMGSCQGHALSSVCEMAYRIATGEVTQFSEMFGYIATQKIDGIQGDRGSTINGGRKCAEQYGMCPVEVFPYPNPARYSNRIPDEAWAAAEPFKIRSHAFCRDYSDVYEYLASGQGGVEIGISWGLQPNREGVVEHFRTGSGGHAVSFLGYSKRKDNNGRNYLWLANSWGNNWGKGGWAEVAPKVVDDMGQHRYTVMIGMSDLTVPKPRPVDWEKESVFT